MPTDTSAPSSTETPSQSGRRTRVWIDLENTPHIPFFNPIIRELEKRGYEVILTARDAYQTCEMATLYGFRFKKIGRHYGKRRLMKFFGVLARTSQLIPFALRHRPALALNHGSRTQNFACNLLGIPTIGMMDYEHAAELPLLCPKWELVPEVIPSEAFTHVAQERILKYTGIKEDVYVADLKPDPVILDDLELRNYRLVVTVRPPATEAHYHNPEAEVLFERVMDRLLSVPDLKTVMLPRGKSQQASIREKYPQWFKDDRVVIPKGVVNGLNLLWHSDLVVSGGGTMNREAAALGVPVYSIFRGKIGAVDRALASQGRLVLVERPEDVQTKIRLEKRQRLATPDCLSRQALFDIIRHVETIGAARLNKSGAQPSNAAQEEPDTAFARESKF